MWAFSHSTRTCQGLGSDYDSDQQFGMTVADYYPQGKTWWFRLHEKGGKVHDVAAHHEAVEWLDAYILAAGIADETSAPLFRSLDAKGRLTERRLKPKRALEMLKL